MYKVAFQRATQPAVILCWLSVQPSWVTSTPVHYGGQVYAPLGYPAEILLELLTTLQSFENEILSLRIKNKSMVVRSVAPCLRWWTWASSSWYKLKTCCFQNLWSSLLPRPLFPSSLSLGLGIHWSKRTPQCSPVSHLALSQPLGSLVEWQKDIVIPSVYICHIHAKIDFRSDKVEEGTLFKVNPHLEIRIPGQ